MNDRTTRPAILATELLKPGGWFVRNDQLFEIVTWDAKNSLQIQARAAQSDVIQEFTLTELFAAKPATRFGATAAELTSPQTSKSDSTQEAVYDALTLPDHLRVHASALIRNVEAVAEHVEAIKRQCLVEGTPFAATQATRQACQILTPPISLSTYYAQRQVYVQHSADPSRIANAFRRSTRGKTKIEPAAQHFIDTVLRHFFRTNPPLRIQTVYAIAEQIWLHNQRWWLDPQKVTHVANDAVTPLTQRLLDARQPFETILADPAQRQHLTQIQLPSRSWFYEYARWFGAQPGEGSQIYVARHGQADWDANFLAFDQFARTPTLPLQYVFADHYLLDVLHVDDVFREVLGRLWLTVLIDAFSRAVLGLFLSYEAPNILSIQSALRHAIWPKTGLDTFGIKLPWATFGIPQRLLVDNAWAHHSHSFEALIRALAGGGHYTQMELVFRPPYQARYGGLVERLFGNISGQLRQLLPGAILKPEQRAWHNASQGACLLYRDVERIVHQIVVDYMHTPHRELAGQTPHERWMTGLQLMLPVPPPLTPQLERCFWRLQPQPRQATGRGIALFGMHYWNTGLDNLRALNKHGQRRNFHLRYDPLDISTVAIFEEGAWLGDAYARELRLPNGHYEPASLWEIEIAKALAQAQGGRRALRTHSWLIHLLEGRALIEQRQQEQKAIRRKTQQLKQKRRGRPPGDSVLTSQVALEAAQMPTRQTIVASPTANVDNSDSVDPRNQLLAMLREVL